MIINIDQSEFKHFTLQELGEGIHAAISARGSGAACNTGIIDLGGMQLVFDAFHTPSAGEDLHRAAVKLTGSEPDFLINSHYHNDHTWGNQAFSEKTHVVSTQRTRELILSKGREELDEETANAQSTLERIKQQVQNARDERLRTDLELFLGSYTWLVKDLSRLKVRMPDVLFTDRLAFQGSTRRAELIAFKDGHTGDDSVLFLPDDGIVFMGDLLFVRCHPYLGECDPNSLKAALREVKSWGANIFVPGHGPVGKTEDLDRLFEYIEVCETTAGDLIKQGKTDADAVNAMHIPEKFKDWEIGRFFPVNLRAMIKRMRE